MSPGKEADELAVSNLQAEQIVHKLEDIMGRASTIDEHADLLLIAHQLRTMQERWKAAHLLAQSRAMHDHHMPAKPRVVIPAVFGALQGRQGLRGGRL